MITISDSPVKRSGTPNQLLGVRVHTIACCLLTTPNLQKRGN
jgi:hypothetical protein